MFRNVFSPFHPRRCVRFLELPQLFQPPLLGCAFGGLRCGCGGQLRGQFLNLTFSTREGKTMGQAIGFSPLNPLRLGVLSEAGVRY